MPYLELLTKSTKDNNKSYDEFDMDVFEWKDNAKNVFGMRRIIEEGNNKLYLLFKCQC